MRPSWPDRCRTPTTTWRWRSATRRWRKGCCTSMTCWPDGRGSRSSRSTAAWQRRNAPWRSSAMRWAGARSGGRRSWATTAGASPPSGTRRTSPTTGPPTPLGWETAGASGWARQRRWSVPGDRRVSLVDQLRLDLLVLHVSSSAGVVDRQRSFVSDPTAGSGRPGPLRSLDSNVVGSVAVDVRDLVQTFGSVRAVEGLSLQAEAGKVTALLGPNGAGKTTTVEICEG